MFLTLILFLSVVLVGNVGDTPDISPDRNAFFNSENIHSS